ncbi:COG4315 family predicted lipoprotein [Actinomadura monticuli]|uniref:Lipoprotein n=1 Tax=Actinomadura monticuli TaxID=3097367 RepID=A0ABV4QF23_9ACTN
MSKTQKAGAAVPVRRAPRRGPRASAAVVAVAALAVAGCGGGSSNKAASTSPAPASSTPSGAAGAQSIKTATVGNLGPVLVDGQGRTLYLFEKDKNGMSSCTGSCAAVWPPVDTSAKPTARPGADAAKLSTTKRPDGSMQVTYAGHPVYYYAPDGTTPGNAQGEGLNQFGAAWYVLSASGGKVVPKGGGY